MAHVETFTGKRKDNRGRPRKSYRVRYRTPTEDKRTKTFRTRAEADAFAAEIETTKAAGEWIDPRRGEITLRDLMEGYLDRNAPHWSRSTRANYRGNVERYLYPVLGARPINTLRPGDFGRLVKGLSHLRPSTIDMMLTPTRGALDEAVLDDRIRRNPARDAVLRHRGRPADPDAERVFLSADQLNELADAVPAKYRALILLAGYLGPRIGEFCGLNVGDFDAMHRSLRIERTYSLADGVAMLGPVKSRRPYSIKPLPKILAAALLAHIGEHVADPSDPEAPIFTSKQGDRLRPDKFGARIFNPAAEAIGLDPRPRVHDLRHTAVSLASSAGMKLEAISVMVNHRNSGITRARYLHVFAEDQATEMGKLDAAITLG